MVAPRSKRGGIMEHQKGTRCDSSTVPAAVIPLDSMLNAQCPIHNYNRESCIVNRESQQATGLHEAGKARLNRDKSEDLPF